ncbi:MbtH family protein [Streptomyces sp. WM6368]|uniref:MbtH family protein n=1 Tax=Streptomyces sp. WM6368 TaxID=1415554 RepID=UPI0006B00C6F|nr:MbtH family NRPS accessory protein [Streptomyces sp. WM6368]KOU22200.1 antibiotic synthesis protein MbtH [Streptomyces sp. WM6368]
MPEEEFNADSFDVVVNDEEQYSIWQTGRELPSGWIRTGHSGPKRECLDHIDMVWTDMRPLSLRRHMERQSQSEYTVGRG